MTAAVEIDHVTQRFGDFTAVHDATLTIEAGEFFSFLGPSGCGKTTLLRLVSGFTEPTAGRISIGGKDMRGIGPNKRPTAMIFQNLALFPLMSVAENIAFGLEVRGLGKAARRRRADELLDLIALPGQGDKKVSELSGGQRQRVAIARALAVEPAVLLLDEPLSALDLKLRQHMRAELRAIQKRTGVTFIYITHDQGEALAMSDRVAVMRAGHIEQVASPTELYDRPATGFVAGFVGETNRIPGRLLQAGNGYGVIETAFGPLSARFDGADSDSHALFVRPERLGLGDAGRGNRLQATIENSAFEGAHLLVFARLADGSPLTVQVPNGGQPLAVAPGEGFTVSFAADDATILPAEA
ncbi:ABC transporter ATP-binding protein [Zavarzinia compransoris]|uniref:ABC transporter ATP-binding protein n=1 Tax=Zavarzinia compransoris TaxID=1264899 RepID=A0A317EB17_9PROT|nr:ABC transporter ATP-binding protein [Zavarzinia compransoris]PWR23474.1 ABC transporter ATP-binding protein [Zavarzinia compransoris]TDP45946.1 spermidine/putrescine transport system ATP-binding protein [Zavarzinia compransoris]